MLDQNISLKEYLETLPQADQSAAKSELFNIFRVNPWLSKLYGAYFLCTGRNPFSIKNLQTRSELFFDPDLTQGKGKPSMSATQPVRICTHIKPSGVRCGSPALRSEIFCYFHQRMIRGVRTPPKSRLHPIAILEDSRSIQASLMEIINALVRNTIDYRRAQLILRALHMAAKNARRANFDVLTSQMVEEVPEYPAPRPVPNEARKRKPATAQAPTLPQNEGAPESEWDWSEIRRKIDANTYFEPSKPATIADAIERKLPEGNKVPSQSRSSLKELASQLFADTSPT
jgi:cell pole-organizing protein PopZ